MNKIRLGIAGCGIATRKLHLPALKKLGNIFEVAALYNRTERRSQELAGQIKPSPRVFNNYVDMLESGEIDAVDISLPPGLNNEFISQALDAGIHVICEKPISNSTAEGKKVVELAERSDRVVYIAENFRHVSKFTEASRLIESGKIGSPVFFQWQSWVRMSRDNEYVNTSWRKHPDHIGGYLSDGGVHHIAAIRLLAGDIAKVTAFSKTVSDYLGAEDTLACVMQTKNGSLVSYNVSYALYKCGMSATIIGSDGCMHIADSRITLDSHGKKDILDIDQDDSYEREFVDFHRTVCGERNILGSPLSALHDLAVIEAAVISSNTDRRVFVDSLL